MSAKRDWLPQNHEALYDQANQTVNYLSVTANRDRMGFAVDTAIGKWFDTEFISKHNAFKAAFADWQNPAERTPTKTVKLAEAEEAFKMVYRKLYNGFLKESPLVTDDDLISMGLPKRNTSRTPAKVADVSPDSDVDTSVPGRLAFSFYQKGGRHKKGKPEDQHGVEIACVISDTKPEKWEDLTISKFATRSPYIMSFENNQRGQTLYYAMRWENTRGEKGPWSDIAGIIIP
jgi:hypothetical protein